MPKERIERDNFSKLTRELTIFRQKTAERKLGVALPDSTITAWTCLSKTMRLTDDFIDSPQTSEEDRINIYEQAVSYLLGDREELSIDDVPLVHEARLLKEHLNSVSEGQRAAFVRNLRRLFRMTEAIREEDNPKIRAKMVMHGGDISARLFTSFLPEEFLKLAKYRDFLRFTTRLTRVVTGSDAVIDLPADYEHGLALVRPTIRNRAVIAANTLPTLMYVATHMDYGLLGTILKVGLEVAKDRKGQNNSIHLDLTR